MYSYHKWDEVEKGTQTKLKHDNDDNNNVCNHQM